MNETQLGGGNQQQQGLPWTISSSINPTLPMLDPSLQQQQNVHAPTPTSDRAPLSIYERIRHFLYINLLLNKYSFILSILSYVAQLFLFVALNLYLFSNVSYLYELTCLRLPPPPPHSSLFSSFSSSSSSASSSQNISAIGRDSRLLSNITQSKFSSSIKQSYLTLQIITLFVFFICFILAALIRLQFKYHRLALNLYDYDLEQGRGGGISGVGGSSVSSNHGIMAAAAAANLNDRDGGDSLASTTTGSHFSSSMSKRLTSLFKRLLHRLLTKIASILLYVTLGYHFCQNCFIESSSLRTTKVTGSDDSPYSIVTHVVIFIAVLFRSIVVILEKRNAMNRLDYVKRLQRKHMMLLNENDGGGYKQQSAVDEIELAPASRTGGVISNTKGKHYDAQNYYSYYYTYLIKYNQSAFNQLKQHQQNQTRFRVFHLNDLSLLVGFTLALFHLFSFGTAVQLLFVFAPIFFTLMLFRLKSILNACLSLVAMFTALFYLSSFATSRNNSSAVATLNISSVLEKTFPDDNCGGNHSTVREFQTASNALEINICGLNLLTLISFLITLYLKSALNIYYCTLTSLERWNLAFLSTLHPIWRQAAIWTSFVLYAVYGITCSITLLLSTLGSWRVFVIFPLYTLVSLFWCAFELLNTVNLLHLMKKITDCFLLLNESNSVANSVAGGNGVGGENSSNLSRKSKSNRQSTLSQHSQSNHNLSSGSVSVGKTTRCSLRKLLSIFLSYHKLNVDESGHSHPAFNIPIHRILNYKGVRHLGSISYRIALYCLALTLMLAPFTLLSQTSASDPITLGLYVSALSASLLYLSLLYQFPASQTGSCIAYVCVSPPLAFNIYQTHTMSSNGGGGASTTMSSSTTGNSSTSKTTTSSSKSRTASSGFSSGGATNNVGTGPYMPFNYQQALQHRCAYLLQRMQAFLQFHLIDNFGCDLAPASGFRKNVLESKLAAFFRKRPTQNESCNSEKPNYYNTYMLYYCGPTSPLTDSLAFVDGSELSLDEIISLWKQIHCPDSASKSTSVPGQCNQPQTSSDEETVVSELPKVVVNEKKPLMTSSKSRLIIILDAENTSKSLEYVRSKCRESNVYIALQTAKYNYLSGAAAGKTKSIGKQGVENRLLSNKRSTSKKLMSGPPGSPQTLTATSQSFFDSYLNMGKFTLDWIKSNSNAAAAIGGGLSSSSYDAGVLAGIGVGGEIVEPSHSDTYFMKMRDFSEHAHLNEDDQEEEDDEEPEEEDSENSEDDSSQDSEEVAAVTAAAEAATTDNNNQQQAEQTHLTSSKKSLKKSTAPLPPTMSAIQSSSATHTNGVHNHHSHPAPPHRHHHHHAESSNLSASSSGSGSFFYEAKCAFSHYWLDFTFDSAESGDDATVAADLTQFWNIYYPCRVCRPLLAMINCPLFYLKLEPLRRLLLWARRFKARLLPVHEFETGHGFKLFSS